MDTWNPGVAKGMVAESDETNNRVELTSFQVGGLNPTGINRLSVEELPPRPV